MSESPPLDQVVFVVEDGKIVADAIRNFRDYIDETTTPHGIGARYHIRGKELWTWGHAGGFPRLIRAYDTEAEAIEALEQTFVYDFWNSVSITAFSFREEAEEFLIQIGA